MFSKKLIWKIPKDQNSKKKTIIKRLNKEPIKNSNELQQETYIKCKI